MKIILEYEAKITDCAPVISFASRHSSFSKDFYVSEGPNKIIEHDLNLNCVDQLRIKFNGKVHSDQGETWLQIHNILIDDINIQHMLFTGKQWPEYNSNFYETESPPDFYCPGTKFFHNGVFNLDIKLPIWKWLLEKTAELATYPDLDA